MSPENLDPHLFIPEEELMGAPAEAKRERARSPEELAKVAAWVRENQLGSLGYDLTSLADAMVVGIPPQKIREATKWAEAKHEGEEKALRNQLSVTDRTNLWLILGAYEAATHETNKAVEVGLQDALEAERKDAELQAQLEAAAGEEGKQDLGWVKAGLTLHEWKRRMAAKPKPAQVPTPATATEPPQQENKKERPQVPPELSGTMQLGNMMEDSRRWLTGTLAELLKLDSSLSTKGLVNEMLGRPANDIASLKLAFDYTVSHPEDEAAVKIRDAAWARLMPDGQNAPRWMELLRMLADMKRGERLAEKRADDTAPEELAA